MASRMRKHPCRTAMACILVLEVMACRALKWVLMEGYTGRSEILVLMAKDRTDKNGNIPIPVLSQDVILTEVILKFLLRGFATHMNLPLMNMEILSAKTMTVITPVKKKDWFILSMDLMQDGEATGSMENTGIRKTTLIKYGWMKKCFCRDLRGRPL